MSNLFEDLPPPKPKSSGTADGLFDDLPSTNQAESLENDNKKKNLQPGDERKPLIGAKRKSDTDSLDGFTKKSIHSKIKYKLQGFLAERKGERDEMQDTSVIKDDCTSDFQSVTDRVGYYAVFDGHAGSHASQFAAEKLLDLIIEKFPSGGSTNFDKNLKKCLIEAFKETDEQYLQEASKVNPPWKDGSTAVCILVIDDVVYAANIGDSKALLVRTSKDNKNTIVSLSKDHSPEQYEERMRIQKSGGNVRDGRVLGILEVSRSFGDGRFKRYGVIATPDVTKCALTDNDRYLLLACDGLWKGFTVDAAVKYIDNTLKETSDETFEKRFELACSRVASEAIRRGSSDNVTVILIPVSPIQ